MAGGFVQAGHTLIELMISVAIAAMLLTGLQQLLGTGVSLGAKASQQTELARQGSFAMTRMVDAVSAGGRLLIPLADDPASDFNETIREQTVPASPLPLGSIFATAVLAVTLNHTQDLDSDGIADADNDGDGRIDEDLPADVHNDGKPGVRGFDDDGRGYNDSIYSSADDDDESFFTRASEDPINGLDDDNDGGIDEDPGADNNGDGCPGICGVDDDGDGLEDEDIGAGGPGNYDNIADDDEDGYSDEDWYDPVVFYLQGAALIERRAVPWDENNDGEQDGQDFVESTIADHVTRLRFERPAIASDQHQLVDITLTLTNPNGETISLNAQVRVGGWQ